jgi:hypothetical protein
LPPSAQLRQPRPLRLRQPPQPPRPPQRRAREVQSPFDADAAIASVRAELRACVGVDTQPSAAQAERVHALVRRFAAARQLSFVVLLLRTVRRLCVDYEDATPVWMQFSSDVVVAAQRLLPLPIALHCIWNR